MEDTVKRAEFIVDVELKEGIGETEAEKEIKGKDMEQEQMDMAFSDWWLKATKQFKDAGEAMKQRGVKRELSD